MQTLTETTSVRKQLIEQTLDATTLPEIKAAWQALQEWMQTHPEDEGMRAGFEQLAQMQEIAEMMEAEVVAPVRQVA